MSGTQISAMTPLAVLPDAGAVVPVVKAGEATNYAYDIAAKTAQQDAATQGVSDGLDAANIQLDKRAYTATTLAELKAAPINPAGYIFAPPSGSEGGAAAGTFLYQTAGAPYTADGVNIIKLDAVPLSTGALVRQTANSVTYRRDATGATPLSLLDKAGETLSAREFGITPATADDTTAVANLVAAMNSQGGAVRLSGGDIKTSKPVQIKTAGVDVYGAGQTRLYGTGTDQGVILGATNTEGLSLTTPIAGTMAKGSSSVQVSSVAGYYVGQSVLVIGGRSMHSSPGNSIPLDKQWFTIRSINASTNTLSFTGVAETDFTVANYGEITKATAPIAVTSTVRNLNITNDSTFSGPYSQSMNGARCVSVRDCVIDGYSAATFQAFVDHAVYENVALIGYNGISPARGTKRIVFRDCSYEPRYESEEGYCAYIEEGASDVRVDNFRARGGQFRITASGDELQRKRVLVTDLDLKFNPPRRLNGGAGYINCPAIETIFGSTSDGFARFDGGMIVTPGGNTGGVNVGTIPKCAVYMDSSSKVQLRNLDFAGLDADAWAIAVNGNNCYRLEIENCRIVDGSGRGLCHPSVLTNLSVNPDSCTVSRIKDLEIAYTAGTALVRTTLTWLPREGYMLARHQFLTVPAGTYRFLQASKPNGVHGYEVTASASGTGRSIAAKVEVTQDFNTAPVVTTQRALGASALAFALDGSTGTKGTITIGSGDASDNLVLTVLYDLMEADPTTQVSPLIVAA